MPSVLVVRRLVDVLERENAALTVMDLREAATLTAEKAVALEALAACARIPGLARELGQLDALAAENRRLLERAIAAQQRVIGIVVRATASVGRGASYRATGRTGGITGPVALSTRA